VEDLLSILEELLIAFCIGLASFCDLFDHRSFITNVIESITIAPNQSIHWLNFHELDVILQISIRKVKQIRENVWCCNHGRTCIKGEAIVMVDISPTTRQITCFVKHSLNACALKTDCGTKPTKSAADDGCLLVGFCRISHTIALVSYLVIVRFFL